MSAVDAAFVPRRPAHVGLKWGAHQGKIGAWIAESDFGTAPAVTRALHSAIDDAFLTYLPTDTARAAEQACATFYAQRYGWHIPAEIVHLIPDVVAGLRLTIEHFTRAGSAVIVPTPSYMPFLTEPARLGRDIVQVPSALVGGRWRMDLAGIERAFAAGAGLLVLCNPHNPLGQVLTIDEMRAVAEVVERHGGRVFSDEIHAPIVYPDTRHVPYASHSDTAARHTVTATATSKGWNIPGLKAAQLILTSATDQAHWMDRDPAPTQSGSILGAIAATAAYTDGIDWLDEVIHRFDQNRRRLDDLIASRLPQVGYTRPDATYLAWLDFSAYRLDTSPAAFLAQHANVVTTDGALCGTGHENHVRFNFAMPPETLERAIENISAALPAPRVPSSGHNFDRPDL